MATGRRPNNNILAGSFLLLGVALAIAISFILSGVGDRLKSTRDYVVVFSLADGATGIKPTSGVLLGGQPVGKVTGVSITPTASADRPAGVEVTISVESKYGFLNNATAYLERPLLGSFSTINFTSLGDADKPGAAALPEGGRIKGMLAPPAFLAQAGFGPEQAALVQEILRDSRDSIQKLSSMVDEARPKVDATIEDVRTMVADVRQKWPDWTARADAVTKNLESASGKIDPVLAEAADAVKEARAAVAKADEILAKADPKVASILESVDSAAKKVDSRVIDSVLAAITDSQRALDSFTTSADTVTSVLREQMPNLRRAMGNVRLISDQAKLAIIELRSQPWRLLHTPGEKETETSVLYDSARSYAAAVSDLRAASESLESTLGSVSANPGSSGPQRESLEFLTAQLKTAFEKYRDAERGLIQRLIDRGGESANMGRTAEVGSGLPGSGSVAPEPDAQRK